MFFVTNKLYYFYGVLSRAIILAVIKIFFKFEKIEKKVLKFT